MSERWKFLVLAMALFAVAFGSPAAAYCHLSGTELPALTTFSAGTPPVSGASGG